MPWDPIVERTATRLVQATCAPARSTEDRDRSWQALLVEIVPHLETWISRKTVLRRLGLASEDDVRTVLVDVIARLHAHDCRNLRDFLASEPPDPDDLDELALIGELSSLTGEPESEPGDAAATPFQGWLLTLCRFVAKDHVKKRFGWTSLARTHFAVLGAEPEPRATLAAAVLAAVGVLDVRWDADTLVALYRPSAASLGELTALVVDRGWQLVETARPRNKRDLYSGADRLDAVAERGERPPITDLITAREVLVQVRDYMATLPEDMRRALELWMTDTSIEDIAGAINMGVPSARALVRAGQARLRERFRPAIPALFG